MLASIATILRGGGIQNLETIQTEIFNVLNGRGDQIREFLNRLDTFTDQLNQQRDDITHAIDSTNRLLSIVAQRTDTLDRVLTEFPPLIKHFADTRDLFADAVTALGRIGVAADNALAPSSGRLAGRAVRRAAAIATSRHSGTVSITVRVHRVSWNAMKPRFECVLTQWKPGSSAPGKRPAGAREASVSGPFFMINSS